MLSVSGPPPNNPPKRKRVNCKCSHQKCDNRAVQGGVCVTHCARRKCCAHPRCDKAVRLFGAWAVTAEVPPRGRMQLGRGPDDDRCPKAYDAHADDDNDDGGIGRDGSPPPTPQRCRRFPLQRSTPYTSPTRTSASRATRANHALLPPPSTPNTSPTLLPPPQLRPGPPAK